MITGLSEVLLDFFQKIAVSKGRAFGCPSQRAASFSKKDCFRIFKLGAQFEDPGLYSKNNRSCLKNIFILP